MVRPCENCGVRHQDGVQCSATDRRTHEIRRVLLMASEQRWSVDDMMARIARIVDGGK
jgi:hypothetical protein